MHKSFFLMDPKSENAWGKTKMRAAKILNAYFRRMCYGERLRSAIGSSAVTHDVCIELDDPCVSWGDVASLIGI